jgi:flagellar biosynthetic protein FliR
LTAFVLFCRIGGCLMLMPGFSNQRIPLNVRLFIAFSVTLALTPLLANEIQKSLSGIAPVALTRIFISETLIGAVIGFLARSCFGALETLGALLRCLSGYPARSPVPLMITSHCRPSPA